MPEVMYIPRPLIPCTSPAPCPDPCDTEAVRLKKQTQCICGPAVEADDLLVDLLAFWTMDETSANREDSHTGNHDLTPSSNDSSLTVPGVIGNAINLIGSSGNFAFNSGAQFGITGAMTMAGWIKFTNLAAGPVNGWYIVGKQNLATIDPGSFTDGYMLILNTSNKFAFWQGDGASTSAVESSVVASTGLWYFVAVGYTGSQIFVQVNNSTRIFAAGITPSVGDEDFQFSSYKGVDPPNPPEFFGSQGYIDEFSIWTRALSEDEVSYLYNSDRGRTYPFT